MHHALQIPEVLTEILHFVPFSELAAAGLTCKTFLASARPEFRRRRLQRPSSLVETYLPSDLIDPAPLRMLSAYSSSDKKPIEEIFPLCQSAVLKIQHSFASKNDLTHLVADLQRRSNAASSQGSASSGGSGDTSEIVYTHDPAYRQYVRIFRRAPTKDDIARFHLATSQCTSLQYGGCDHKALLVIITLERLFPDVDFFPELDEVIIEHPHIPESLPIAERVNKLSTPHPLLRKVQSIVIYGNHKIRLAEDHDDDVHISWWSNDPPVHNLRRVSFETSRLASPEDSWRSQGTDTTTQTPFPQRLDLRQLMQEDIAQKRSGVTPTEYMPQNLPQTVVVKPQSFATPAGIWRLAAASQRWLRTITLPATPSAAGWTFLSSLKFLERLDIGQYTQGGHFTDDWRPDRFTLRTQFGPVLSHVTIQDLKSLVIRRHGVSARLISVFHSVHFPQLVRLIIQDPVEESAVENMPFVLEHIGTHMPELRYLSIEMGVAEVHDGDEVVPYPIFRTAEAVCALLAKTPLLEHFHIICSPRSFIPSLENSHIPIIAASISHIKHFYLDPLRSPNSSVTLNGLLPFSQSSPDLIMLGIGLNPDASNFTSAVTTADKLLDEAPTSQSKIETLNVGVRGIQNSNEATKLLHTIFPSLKCLEPAN